MQRMYLSKLVECNQSMNDVPKIDLMLFFFYNSSYLKYRYLENVIEHKIQFQDIKKKIQNDSATCKKLCKPDEHKRRLK